MAKKPKRVYPEQLADTVSPTYIEAEDAQILRDLLSKVGAKDGQTLAAAGQQIGRMAAAAISNGTPSVAVETFERGHSPAATLRSVNSAMLREIARPFGGVVFATGRDPEGRRVVRVVATEAHIPWIRAVYVQVLSTFGHFPEHMRAFIAKHVAEGLTMAGLDKGPEAEAARAAVRDFCIKNGKGVAGKKIVTFAD